jgi:arylsulfatase A-like enzyme
MGGFTGYYTHIGDAEQQDFWEGETPLDRHGYVTDLLSDRAADWIATKSGGEKPYLLSLHYTAPHWPWSAPSVEAAARERETVRSEITEGGSTRIYGEMMQILDAGIGRVLDAVRRGNGAGGRDTLVLFTSDNGGERFSKIWPFVGRKFDLLEGGLRVPQICWRPGHIPAGQVTDQMSITMDLTATCLAAAGVAASPEYPLEGVDLMPMLTGAAAPFERTLYWRMRNRYQRAVRRGGWKYLKVADREFLFDIAYDHRERGDLSKKQPALLDELRALWEAWDRDMLALPEDAQVAMSNLSDMLW